jgi:sigma-B regulation protein RsbU (phosphoserine phosphatase)
MLLMEEAPYRLVETAGAACRSLSARCSIAADGSPRMIRTAIFDATERRGYERELLRAKQRAEASEAQAKALARTLQQTLIPQAPPEIPGLDVAAVYRPAGSGDEVGGDFYDIFEVGAEDWVIVVGDVCGRVSTPR